MEKNQIHKHLEFNVLKTIAAFLNTKGGTLVIGVTDEKKVVGIEREGFDSLDSYSRHLVQIINNKFSKVWYLTSLIAVLTSSIRRGKLTASTISICHFK